jgi:hypothetical protein
MLCESGGSSDAEAQTRVKHAGYGIQKCKNLVTWEW